MLLGSIGVLALILAAAACAGDPLWMFLVFFVSSYLALLGAAFLFLAVICLLVDTKKEQ